MRPMSEFDPSKQSMVHDALNDKTFAWEPENYLKSYREYGEEQSDGIVAWDGLLLDGWYELAHPVGRVRRGAP
jgi:hypothetical protein